MGVYKLRFRIITLQYEFPMSLILISINMIIIY